MKLRCVGTNNLKNQFTVGEVYPVLDMHYKSPTHGSISTMNDREKKQVLPFHFTHTKKVFLGGCAFVLRCQED